MEINPNEVYTPEETAKRECKEETGLDVEIIGDTQPDLFVGAAPEGRMLKKPLAMLLEDIPACPERNKPRHEHMDFLFLARPLDASQELQLAEAEGRELQWFTRAEIEALPDGDIFSNVRAYILAMLP